MIGKEKIINEIEWLINSYSKVRELSNLQLNVERSRGHIESAARHDGISYAAGFIIDDLVKLKKKFFPDDEETEVNHDI